TGSFYGRQMDFDPGAGVADLSLSGEPWGTDVYVSKLDPLGGFVWARRAGTDTHSGAFAYEEYGTGIAVDNFGGVYTTGSLSGTGPGVFGGVTVPQPATQGNGDVFVARQNAATGDFLWASRGGGLR